MKQLRYEQVSAGDAIESITLEISTTDIVAGALASRDYSPLHHDYHYATEQAGHRDIFLNTPHQAALLEKFLDDWSGPRGRLGRMRFTMKSSVYAGDRITIKAEVSNTSIDDRGCGWVELKLWIDVGENSATTCDVRYALPRDDKDNPWMRTGEAWQP